MATDLSLLEIDGADDSLLETLIKEGEENNNDNNNINLDLDSPTVDFTCSPLLRSKPPPAKPPRIPHSAGVALKDKDEGGKPCGFSLVEANNKENLNEDKSNAVNSTKEQNQGKRRKVGGYNLRKSLAWNNAFFTEEGVLDPIELSRLSNVGGGFLCVVPEEETPSLSADPKATGDGLYLQDLEKKLFDEIPLRSSLEDKSSGSSSIKTESSVQEDAAPVPKAARRVHVVKAVNRSVSQAGGSLRPSSSSSHKSLPSTNVRNAPVKDSKLPKFTTSKSESSSCSTTSKVAVGAKRSHSIQNTPEVSEISANFEKNVGRKGSLNNSKFVPGCITSTAKSSVHRSIKNMENFTSVNRLSSNQPQQPSRATITGLKVTPVPATLASKHVPTGDSGKGRAIASLPQNAHYNAGNIPRSRLPPSKPSGLRMPSPSLGYFSQPKVSASSSIPSPRTTQSSSLHESNIPNLRKSSDNKHISEIKLPSAEAITARVPKEGINAIKCLVPSVHGNIDEQCGKQGEMRNPAYDEVECVSHKENQKLQLNANKLFVQSGFSKQSEKDNCTENVTNVKQELNGSRLMISQGPLLVKSEMQVGGGSDKLIVHRLREGVQESSVESIPGGNYELNQSGLEISQAPPLLNSETQAGVASGAIHLIECQLDGKAQNFPKTNPSGDNQVLKKNEVELPQGQHLLNKITQVFGASGADDLIVVQHGEDGDSLEKLSNNQELNESNQESSQPLPSVKSEAQVIGGANSFIDHQSRKDMHESLKRNMPVDNQELDDNGVEMLDGSPLLSSEMRLSGGSDNLVENHKGGVQESLNASTLPDDEELNENEVEIPQTMPLLKSGTQVCRMSAADEHQLGVEEHESPKTSMQIYNKELDESGGKISETSPLLNSKRQVYGGGVLVEKQREEGVQESPIVIMQGAADIIKHQHGEELHKSSNRNTFGDNQELNERGVAISEVLSLSNSELQVNEGSDNLIEHQKGEVVQELSHATVARDMVEHQHGEVHESSKGNTSVDNQEHDESESELSETSPLLYSEAQVNGGAGNFIEHQHSGVQELPKEYIPGDILEQLVGEAHESSKRNTWIDNKELYQRGVEISETSSLLNSGTQVHGGVNILIEHKHCERVHESLSDMPGTDGLVKHLYEKEVHEFLNINMQVDNQDLNENGVQKLEASPLLYFEAQVHGGANDLIDNQHGEEVQESMKAHKPDDLIAHQHEVSGSLKGPDNFIEHQHGEVHESSDRKRSVDNHDLNENGVNDSTDPQHRVGVQSLKANISGPHDLIEPQHEQVSESLQRSVPLLTHLNESERHTLNSEIQVSAVPGTDNLVKDQHGEEAPEFSNRPTPVDNQGLNGSEREAPLLLISKMQVSGGSREGNFIEYGEEVQESPKIQQSLDNEVVIGIEEVSRGSLLANSEMQLHVSGAENSIEHWHEECVQRNKSLSNQLLNGSDIEIPQAALLLNSEMQVDGISGAENLIGNVHVKEVQASFEINTSFNNDKLHESAVEKPQDPSLLKSEIHLYDVSEEDSSSQQQHMEEVHEASKISITVDNQEFSGSEVADNLVEHRHIEELREFSIRNPSVGNKDLKQLEVEIPQVLPVLNTDLQVCSVSVKDNLIEQQHGEELQEFSKRSMPVECQILNESEVEISQAAPWQNSEVQVNGVSGANCMIEHAHEKEVRYSSQKNTSLDIKHLHENEVESPKSPPLLNSGSDACDGSGTDSLIEHQLGGEVLEVDGVSGANCMTEHAHEKEVRYSSKRNTSLDINHLHENEVESPKCPPLLNSGSEACDVLGVDSLIEHQLGGELLEFFESNTSTDDHDDISGIQVEDATGNSRACILVVHNDRVVAGQSGDQVDPKMASVDNLDKVQHMENHIHQKNHSVLVDWSRDSEESLKDNILGNINFRSGSSDSSGIKEQSVLRKPWTGELEEIQHEDNCVPQDTEQGRASEEYLESNHENSYSRLRNTYSSGTKVETSILPSKVRSVTQENGVTIDEEMIKDIQAEGLGIVSLDGHSVVDNLDTSSNHYICLVGDNLDEQSEEQAWPSTYIPDEEQRVHENDHGFNMKDNTLLNQNKCAEEFLTDKSYETLINVIPDNRDSGASNSRTFQSVSQELAMQGREGDAETVSISEHPLDEEAAMESLSINHSNQISAFESTTVVLSTEHSSDSSITCSFGLDGSSTEKLDSAVQTVLNGNISPAPTIGGNESMNSKQSDGAKSTDLSPSRIKDFEDKCELENDISPREDKAAIFSEQRKSLDDSKIDALSIKHKLTAVPFSDEWLAALEAAGEDILTLKTGPVQNSPPDKSLPEPGPWSPVKKKSSHEIGPFDCTKCTSRPPPHLD